jgi:hypothetical protein
MRRRRHRRQRSGRFRARLSDPQCGANFPPLSNWVLRAPVRRFLWHPGSRLRPKAQKGRRNLFFVILELSQLLLRQFDATRAKGLTTKFEILSRFQSGGRVWRRRSVEPAHDRPVGWTSVLFDIQVVRHGATRASRPVHGNARGCKVSAAARGRASREKLTERTQFCGSIHLTQLCD